MSPASPGSKSSASPGSKHSKASPGSKQSKPSFKTNVTPSRLHFPPEGLNFSFLHRKDTKQKVTEPVVKQPATKTQPPRSKKRKSLSSTSLSSNSTASTPPPSPKKARNRRPPKRKPTPKKWNPHQTSPLRGLLHIFGNNDPKNWKRQKSPPVSPLRYTAKHPPERDPGADLYDPKSHGNYYTSPYV